MRRFGVPPLLVVMHLVLGPALAALATRLIGYRGRTAIIVIIAVNLVAYAVFVASALGVVHLFF